MPRLQVLRAGRNQLRPQGALGPLQDLAVLSVMTFTLKAVGRDTEPPLQYRVNGTAGSGGLDKLAPAVDGLLMQQLDRLRRYAETDTADASSP